MQATGNLVGSFAEFSAGVEVGEYEFERGDVVLRMDVYWNTSAIVFDRAGSVQVNGYADVGTESGEGFVDRVVDNFEYAVMKSAFISISNIHIRAFSYAFEAFKLLDIGRIVVCCSFVVNGSVFRVGI